MKHSTESGPVLVLGGYGTFGRLITRALAATGLVVQLLEPAGAEPRATEASPPPPGDNGPP